ncbi:VPLPA-CTERM sorting domain-containing protein [Algirhabdus cladophorae]|uniref:VPLPA-CTERM sorting domain-containing protein n=1 Tax=Algirhabdus cladophorae TaxID=3377108 RepID=UPI003B84B4BE
MLKFYMLGLATAAAVSFGSVAGAATIDAASQNASNPFANAAGTGKLSFNATHKINGVKTTEEIGAFRMTGSYSSGGRVDFLAVSTQMGTAFDSTQTSYEMADPFSDRVTAQLNALASNAWSLVTTKSKAVGFQAAVWEIINETNATKGLNVKNGDFVLVQTTRGDVSDKAREWANEWLGYIADGTWTNTNAFQQLTTSDSANLLTDISGQADAATNTLGAVPLPASSLLLITGLFGAGYVARRRKS